MAEDLKAIGIKTSYMAKVYITGLMVAATMENISKIKSKVLASIYGLMEKSTKAIGLMASSMDKAYSQTLKASHEQANGKTEIE